MFAEELKKKQTKPKNPNLTWICEEREGDGHEFTEQNKVCKLQHVFVFSFLCPQFIYLFTPVLGMAFNHGVYFVSLKQWKMVPVTKCCSWQK